MPFKKVLLFLATGALAVAAAGTAYKVTFFQPSWVNGTELKPGEYKIEVAGDKATIKNGKNTVETAVKVESNGEKYSSTAVRYQNGDGKYRIQEIRIGGTNTKLVFNP
jgi:hypothetical protein